MPCTCHVRSETRHLAKKISTTTRRLTTNERHCEGTTRTMIDRKQMHEYMRNCKALEARQGFQRAYVGEGTEDDHEAGQSRDIKQRYKLIDTPKRPYRGQRPWTSAKKRHGQTTGYESAKGRTGKVRTHAQPHRSAEPVDSRQETKESRERRR